MDVSIGIKSEPSSPLSLSHCTQSNFDVSFGHDLFSDYAGNDDLGSDRSFPDDNIDTGFDSRDLSPSSLDDHGKLDFGDNVFSYTADNIDADSGYIGDSGESSGEVSPCSVDHMTHHEYTTKVEYCSGMNYDIEMSDGQKKLCLVCGDIASGFHYGVSSCEACKAFFKRTIQGNINYSCPANSECEITKRRRKACQACRFQKCLYVGMLREGVRLDRVRGGRQKYKRSSESYPYVQQILPIIKKQCVDSYNEVVDNKSLQQLLSIEGPLEKIYARADSSIKDDENKFLTIQSDLADRELVITISWAKQVPGFSSLSLSDQMNLLQHSWLEINLLNLVYRSTPYQGVLRIAEDLKLSVEQAEKCGCSKELDLLTRKMCKKFTSLNITREEYVLLKSIILFNIDVVTERSDAGKALQEKLHESLTDYVKSRNNGGLKRVGQLYLLLPAMTHLKLLAKQYWYDVKNSGKIMMHKLFLEMLEADS